MTNKLLKLFHYCYRLGIYHGMKIIMLLFFSKKGSIVSFTIPGVKHRLYLRAKTSDEYAFRQIFLDKEYEYNYSVEPGAMIDAGANIGFAAIYFANRYPSMTIICLEPEPGNQQVLKQNIKDYPNIKSVESGLWGKSGHLIVKDIGLGNWGFLVEECEKDTPGAVTAMSIPDIMKSYGIAKFDIIKIDIEGSEKEVLEADDVHSWVSKCKVLIIELHDRMKPGTSAALFRTLLAYDPVQVEIKGENLVCTLP